MGIVIFIDKIEYIAHVVFTIPEGFSQARSEGGIEARAPPPLSPKGWHRGGTLSETKKKKMKKRKRKMKERREKGENIGIKSNFCF